MPVTYDKDADATVVLVRSGFARLKSIKVAQRVAAAPRLFLQVHDSISITLGTTLPTKVIPVPAGNTIKDAMVLKEIYAGARGGLEFGTGLIYACTTTPTGLTAPTAGQEPEVTLQWEVLG